MTKFKKVPPINAEIKEILRKGFANETPLKELAEYLNAMTQQHINPLFYKHHSGRKWTQSEVSDYSRRLGYRRYAPRLKGKKSNKAQNPQQLTLTPRVNPPPAAVQAAPEPVKIQKDTRTSYVNSVDRHEILRLLRSRDVSSDMKVDFLIKTLAD